MVIIHFLSYHVLFQVALHNIMLYLLTKGKNGNIKSLYKTLCFLSLSYYATVFEIHLTKNELTCVQAGYITSASVPDYLIYKDGATNYLL